MEIFQIEIIARLYLLRQSTFLSATISKMHQRGILENILWSGFSKFGMEIWLHCVLESWSPPESCETIILANTLSSVQGNLWQFQNFIVMNKICVNFGKQ